MQPLSPQKRLQILRSNPNVTTAEIDEYENLLAAKLARNPLLQRSPAQASEEAAQKGRLQQLKQKLFPDLAQQQAGASFGAAR